MEVHLENKNHGGKRMKKILLCVLVATLLLGVNAGIASATSTHMKGAVGPKETSLTIYNGFALVREVYEVKLERGKNEIWFGDFPDQVDSSSIRIRSLTAPENIIVLEQSFDKNGTIPSFLWIIGPPISKSFIASVKNLMSGCTKNLTTGEITTQQFIRTHVIELSYFVRGITWQAKYRLEINKSEDVFNFSGYVVITNQSGNPVEYKDAKIKLVAGNVHQVGGRSHALGEGKAPSSQFEERRFFEYHTYALGKYITLKWNEMKLIPFFPEISTKLLRNSPTFQKKLIFEGQRSNKVQIWLSFLNSEDNGLGMPLPAGVIQVFKKDSDGQLEFIGEDRIDHTPKDEMINLYIGNAFDIIAERQVRERKKINDHTWEETIEIILNNHKDKNVEITVIEHLPYIDWKIIDIEIKKGFGTPKPEDKKLPRLITYYKKRDAQTIEFRPEVVPKNSRTIIIYKIRYIRYIR